MLSTNTSPAIGDRGAGRKTASWRDGADNSHSLKTEQAPARPDGASATSATGVAKRRPGREHCCNCGAVIVAKRTGRKRLFCSNRCRSEARRARRFVAPGYYPSGATRNAENSLAKSSGCKGNFGDRASVDPGLWRLIVEVEIFAGLAWRPAISQDGVPCQCARFAPKPIDATARIKAAELIAQIPGDLSIPDFLQRRPALDRPAERGPS
jgi:hypothetical protein